MRRCPRRQRPGPRRPARRKAKDQGQLLRSRWTWPCSAGSPWWHASARRPFEAYEHARALDLAEQFFWFFCNDYVELVKTRAYGAHGADAAGSAITALRLALSALLRLFAPVLPFVTEEVWSWWQPGSVHRAPWPEPAEFTAAGPGAGAEPDDSLDRMLAAASGAIAAGAAKSAARLSMRAPVSELVVSATAADLTALTAVLRDVQAAGQVARVELRTAAVPGPEYGVSL